MVLADVYTSHPVDTHRGRQSILLLGFHLLLLPARTGPVREVLVVRGDLMVPVDLVVQILLLRHRDLGNDLAVRGVGVLLVDRVETVVQMVQEMMVLRGVAFLRVFLVLLGLDCHAQAFLPGLVGYPLDPELVFLGDDVDLPDP
jgi:hypothetical protein